MLIKTDKPFSFIPSIKLKSIFIARRLVVNVCLSIVLYECVRDVLDYKTTNYV